MTNQPAQTSTCRSCGSVRPGCVDALYSVLSSHASCYHGQPCPSYLRNSPEVPGFSSSSSMRLTLSSASMSPWPEFIVVLTTPGLMRTTRTDFGASSTLSLRPSMFKAACDQSIAATERGSPLTLDTLYVGFKLCVAVVMLPIVLDRNTTVARSARWFWNARTALRGPTVLTAIVWRRSKLASISRSSLRRGCVQPSTPATTTKSRTAETCAAAAYASAGVNKNAYLHGCYIGHIGLNERHRLQRVELVGFVRVKREHFPALESDSRSDCLRDSICRAYQLSRKLEPDPAGAADDHGTHERE